MGEAAADAQATCGRLDSRPLPRARRLGRRPASPAALRQGGSQMTRMIGPRRSRRRRYTFLAILGAALAAGLLATSGQATLLGDSGTVDVQVPANTASKGGQTNLHAFITYLGSSDANLSASGTGLFDPFLRLQGSPTEQGYNTN